MTTPDNSKWIVAICHKVFLKDQLARMELVELKDPSTNEPHQYVLMRNSSQPQIVEIQSLEADFSSFLVGRHVVKDGNLYVLNSVDPLFFVLRDCENQKQSMSWQPFDQTLEYLVSEQIIRDFVAESQLGHICQTLCNDQTDNVTYYKFSETKALVWLQKKQERVHQCLIRQDKERQYRRQELLSKRPQGSSSSRAGGSISSTFYIPEDPMVEPCSQSKDDEAAASLKTFQQLRLESIQIVCNYLSDAWTERFLNAVDVSEDQVFAQVQAKTSLPAVTNSTATRTTTPVNVTPKAIKLEPARSIANKKLEKVNKRGMSSLTSFFGPPKKKPTTSKG